MIVQSGANCRTLPIRLQLSASPPSISRRRGKTRRASEDVNRDDKWEGTIFKQSTGFCLKYSAAASGSTAHSCDNRWRQPPLHSDGKRTVLPRSAANVDAMAKWLVAGSLNCLVMAWM